MQSLGGGMKCWAQGAAQPALSSHHPPPRVSGVGLSKLHDPAACQFLHPQNGERIPHLSQMGLSVTPRGNPNVNCGLGGILLCQRRSMD